MIKAMIPISIVISKLVLLIFSHLLRAHFNPTVSKLVTYQHGDSRRISDPQQSLTTLHSDVHVMKI